MPAPETARQALQNSAILYRLSHYSPIVVSTIWVNLHLEASDIDVICEFRNPGEFTADVMSCCSHYRGFHISTGDDQVVAIFARDGFDFELYGSSLPVRQQAGYRHFRVMQRLTALGGNRFCEEVKSLKRRGYKTEPAIASLLGLCGDAYLAVAALEQHTDEQLHDLLQGIA